MANYELFIQLNAFKNIMVRLGDGLRIALVAYKKLHKNEISVSKKTLYDMLTDPSTFTNKGSIENFYYYITNHLIEGTNYNMYNEPIIDEHSKLYLYTTPDETDFETIKIPLKLLSYFYSNIWKKIVKVAIFDFTVKNIKHSPYMLYIPFNIYSKIYKNNNLDKEEICLQFLEDLDYILRYNHILKTNYFEYNDLFDIYIPIQFKFVYLP